MLTPLAAQERTRVIEASTTLLRDTDSPDKNPKEHKSDPGEVDNLPRRALAWTKKHSISKDDLDLVFNFAGNEVSIIASIPGKSKREQTINAYVLTGLANLLSNDSQTFQDEPARKACEESGCYDHTNHSKALQQKGNKFAGTKEKGWTLTAPGLVHGAVLVKEIGKPA